MIHTVIVPGVGGSEHDHWQSWLQRELMHCSRVQQDNWNLPILSEWVAQLVKTVQSIHSPVQVVAHSFGCLTTVAALAQHPQLKQKIKQLVLVAPANPERFSTSGFAQGSQHNYKNFFHQQRLDIPTEMLISENDPWLAYDDAIALAKAWNVKPFNLGQAGHVNVASGFGPFPAIRHFMLAEGQPALLQTADHSNLNFNFVL